MLPGRRANLAQNRLSPTVLPTVRLPAVDEGEDEDEDEFRAGRLTVGGYFDGERCHVAGPYAFILREGIISEITPSVGPPDSAFLLPALTDCHVHSFLDGRLTDDESRRQHLASGFDALLSVALSNVQTAAACGISLLRDAGDPYGVNDALRERLRSAPGPSVKLRSPSFALHRPGRYGAFLARAVADDRELVPLVRELAGHADEIKVLLTGPIDFAARAVKGRPQFDLAAARAIVETARQMGKSCFAHANGAEGIRLAVEAGFNSIEHGYFIDGECLRAMAAGGIAWTPTLAPVIAQRELARERPALVTALDEILAGHAESIRQAEQLGVAIWCGSDAGSPGVPHGEGLKAEMEALYAAGLSLELVLRGATTLPRARWGEPPATLTPGALLDVAILAASPLNTPQALRTARRWQP